jgi:uncharacterized protein YndB with AHSA1/START domain
MGILVHHTSFTIERDLPGSPRHAFRFWSDHQRKRQWTSCHPDWTVEEDHFDFRIDGSERVRWRTPDGVENGFRAAYFDIVPDQRIVYGYAMNSGTHQISASLVTVEFISQAKQTRMTYTEQAVFADEADAKIRSSGTGGGFDRLALVIEQSLAVSH